MEMSLNGIHNPLIMNELFLKVVTLKWLPLSNRINDFYN